MRSLAATLAVTSLTLALLAIPTATAGPDVSVVCGDDNGMVHEDVRDNLSDPTHPQCGSITDPCYQDSTCPRGCGSGPDSMVTWVIGPIYCVSAGDAAAPCQGPNEYLAWDVRDTLDDPTHPECGSLTDPCFVKNRCSGGCGGDGVVTWVVGPIYCGASAVSWAPCQGPNEHVIEDAWDTLDDPTHPECGSLTDPCYKGEYGCGGCGPDHVEWVVGPIYCP